MDYLLEYVVCMLGVSLFFVYISVSCSSIVQSYTCLQSPVYDGDDVEQTRSILIFCVCIFQCLVAL